MTERVSYYPGCSLHTGAREYDLSCRRVLQALGVYCAEVNDWNCCGASSAHSAGHALSLSLPLRNLLLCQGESERLVVPCAACYNLLRTTTEILAVGTPEARSVQEQVEQIMGKAYSRKVKVEHPLDLLTQPALLARLKAQLCQSLQGLKLAPYYGCLLVRPENIAFDNPEQPQKMDLLLQELGADVVRWSYKTECCGGGLGITQGKATTPLVDRLVYEAKRAGAEALVTACPLCQANLEGRQSESMPVFYFTELVGLALGLADTEAWFQAHLIDVFPLLNQVKGGSLRVR